MRRVQAVAEKEKRMQTRLVSRWRWGKETLQGYDTEKEKENKGRNASDSNTLKQRVKTRGLSVGWRMEKKRGKEARKIRKNDERDIFMKSGNKKYVGFGYLY